MIRKKLQLRSRLSSTSLTRKSRIDDIGITIKFQKSNNSIEPYFNIDMQNPLSTLKTQLAISFKVTPVIMLVKFHKSS